MGQSASTKLQNQIFELRFQSKQIERLAAKTRKQEMKEKRLVKKYIEQGHHDIAKVHAENAIRQHNVALNYLKLSSRLDAVVSRMQTVQHTNQLSKNMEGVVNVMSSAIKLQDLSKIAKTMDNFEQQFEELDVRSRVMETSLDSNMAQTVPQDEVDLMMQQVADEHGLELTSEMHHVPTVKRQLSQEEETLEQRLAKLEEHA